MGVQVSQVYNQSPTSATFGDNKDQADYLTVVLGGLPLSPSAWTPLPGGLIGALH